MLSEGSAYLDGAGRVLAADAVFRDLVGLPPGDATEALRSRAAGEPALAALLAGRGPEAVRLDRGVAGSPCDLRRHVAEEGMLLRASPAEDALPAPALELALQAVALARLAGSVAHEVKNPLNAMALQVALLGDKLAASEPVAAACSSHLASLKNQIGRINEVVRRYVEIADPAATAGFDAGALLSDAATLFGHEARRHRIVLACEAAPGSARAAGDADRAARLLLGLLWRAVTGTPEGGKLVARVGVSGPEVVLALEHPRGAQDPALAWVRGVVAAGVRDLGGRLEESSRDGVERVAMVLPREVPP